MIIDWINVKDRLPNEHDGDLFLIKLKSYIGYVCVARYVDILLSYDREYKNIFIPICHPRFPKEWLFDERYRKISRIHKSKVEKWMPLKGIYD